MKALLLLLAVIGGVRGFPDGGPVEGCVFETVPNHAGTRPQGAPFKHEFVADSGSFGPHRRQVHVHLTGKPIKGFFIQAVDDVYKPIGKFVKNDFSKLHSECAAITHSHPGPKKDLSFIWQAPKTSKTQNVYFRATILEEYDKYWSKVFAKVLQPSHF